MVQCSQQWPSVLQPKYLLLRSPPASSLSAVHKPRCQTLHLQPLPPVFSCCSSSVCMHTYTPPQSLEPQGIWHSAWETRSEEGKDIEQSQAEQAIHDSQLPDWPAQSEVSQPGHGGGQCLIGSASRAPSREHSGIPGRLGQYLVGGSSQWQRKCCHWTKACREQRGQHKGREGP